MQKERVTVSIDADLLARVDGLVGEGHHKTRSAAVERALEQLLAERRRDRLDEALDALCANPEALAEHQREADEGFGEWMDMLDREDGGWPRGAADYPEEAESA